MPNADGDTWFPERSDRVMSGLEAGPEHPADAARVFLRRRLSRLFAEAGEYDLEDCWLWVSIWHGHRTDETQQPRVRVRLAERAAQFPTPAPLARLLQAAKVDLNAVAIATPRGRRAATPKRAVEEGNTAEIAFLALSSIDHWVLLS